MCQAYADAADLQHMERGDLPPHIIVWAPRLVLFLGLLPPVLVEGTTVYPASEYWLCLWYANSANPGFLSVSCHEFAQPLRCCAVQIHTNSCHLFTIQTSMRDGSFKKTDKQSPGNILLSSQRTTQTGRVGGSASSHSIRFTSNFESPSNLAFFLLVADPHFVQLNLQVLPICLKVVLNV